MCSFCSGSASWVKSTAKLHSCRLCARTEGNWRMTENRSSHDAAQQQGARTSASGAVSRLQPDDGGALQQPVSLLRDPPLCRTVTQWVSLPLSLLLFYHAVFSIPSSLCLMTSSYCLCSVNLCLKDRVLIKKKKKKKKVWKVNRPGNEYHWKDKLFTYRAQAKGAGHVMKGYLGKHQVSQEVVGEETDVDENLYCGFHEKERVRLGLAGLNNFSMLWGSGALSDTWLGGCRPGKQWPKMWEPHKGDSFSVVLYLKSVLVGKLFSISRLTRGAVPSKSERLWMSKHQNAEVKTWLLQSLDSLSPTPKNCQSPKWLTLRRLPMGGWIVQWRLFASEVSSLTAPHPRQTGQPKDSSLTRICQQSQTGALMWSALPEEDICHSVHLSKWLSCHHFELSSASSQFSF